MSLTDRILKATYLTVNPTCPDCGHVFTDASLREIDKHIAVAHAEALKPYTLVAVFLDHPGAVAEVVIQHVLAEQPELAAVVKDDDRPWSIVAVFDGHITPAYMENTI